VMNGQRFWHKYYQKHGTFIKPARRNAKYGDCWLLFDGEPTATLVSSHNLQPEPWGLQ
jgi:hypothetical protein